jgi:pimeloyl-ACP methyl ester carboxylesterase
MHQLRRHLLPEQLGAETIVATLNVPSTDNGNSYDIEVISNGSLASGFQSTGTSAPISSNRVTVPVLTVYTISGTVTNPLGQGVANIEVQATGGPVTGIAYTNNAGYYSTRVLGGASYTVTPSEPTGKYWFNPQNAPNITSTQTVNFTENPVTYVYLIHGIGQSSTDMQGLYQSLITPGTGVDTRKYHVDAGFTFGCASSCNAACVTVNGTMVNYGAQSLASYIYEAPPPGNIILVGYSLGGLIARDLIANNYIGALTGHPVTALITLGTPNLGYPYSSVDYISGGACNQLFDDMAGSWLQSNGTWSELTSQYLSSLRQQWIAASYSGYWMAAAGQQCSNTPRTFPPTSMMGCPSWSVTSDGVVCRDSALYGVPGGYSGFTGGPNPDISQWSDTTQVYVHTTTWAGWGTAPILCGNNPSVDIPLYRPTIGGSLFPVIKAVINAH